MWKTKGHKSSVGKVKEKVGLKLSLYIIESQELFSRVKRIIEI